MIQKETKEEWSGTVLVNKNERNKEERIQNWGVQFENGFEKGTRAERDERGT